MFDIHIGSNLEQSHNIISCDFHVYTESGCFPGKEWNDYVVTVLQWWGNEAQRLKKKRAADFLFEDGPYMLRVSRLGQQLTIRFTDYEASMDYLPSVKMDYYDFLCILINAIRQTVVNIDTVGLSNNANAISLTACVEKLETIKSSIQSQAT